MIEKHICNCAWCGWEWMIRKDAVPKRCPNPKCRTMRWQQAVAVGDSFLKYPVDNLAVDQIAYFKYSGNGKEDNSRVDAIRAWGKRHGRAFYISTIIKDGHYHHRVRRVQ